MSRLLIVSNRLPVSVVKRGKTLRIQPSVGGLATGMSSLLQKPYKGLWIGWPGIALEKITTKEKNEIKKHLDENNLHPVFLSQSNIDNYYSGFCNYDCIICSQVCPTGAILPVTLENKQLIQLGKSIFVKDNCIVHTDKTDCGACSEVCPTKAVYMIPYEGDLFIPEVNNDICLGCGACEYACPTIPYKAIYVDGNAVHLAAEKPEEEELTAPSTEEDFPF